MLGQFLTLTDHFIGWPHVVDLFALDFLDLEQSIDAIECDAAIVAYDAPPPVSIRQAGDNSRFPAPHDLRRICVEHAVVVRLSIFRKCFVDLRVGFKPRGLEPCFDHTQTAVGEDRTLERLIGLQAYDDFVVAVDVARFVSQQCRRGLCVDSQNALFPLFLEVRLQFRPHRFGLRRRRREKFFVPGIGRHIANDKIPHTDRSAPITGFKATPRILTTFGFDFLRKGGTAFHGDFSPYFGACRRIVLFRTVAQRRPGALI